MARADLVLNLVETGMKGDLTRFKKTAEAIADEASARHQHILADKLKTLLTASPYAEERRFTQDASLKIRSTKRNHTKLSPIWFYLTMLSP